MVKKIFFCVLLASTLLTNAYSAGSSDSSSSKTNSNYDKAVLLVISAKKFEKKGKIKKANKNYTEGGILGRQVNPGPTG